MVGPVHMLAGMPAIAHDFASRVPRLLDELTAYVTTHAADNDDTFEDKLVRLCCESIANPQRYSHLAPLVIAYVGEQVRKRRGGDWDLRLGYDGTTCEPWIITDNRHEVPVFHCLDCFAKEPTDWSIEAAVEVAILQGSKIETPGDEPWKISTTSSGAARAEKFRS